MRDSVPIEAWMHCFSFARQVAPHAAEVEAWGFDGMLLADSQNLNADIWVELGLAAAATERIGLGPGVTNPATRDPAVTASAAATLQEESGGRAVLGIGRSDSALSQIGREPVHVTELERALAEIQGFLRGEELELEDGSMSRIGWIADSAHPKGGLSERCRRPADYDESRHGEGNAPHARTLEDEFIDRFAVLGPADEVAERLASLAELGLERLIVVPGSLDADPAAVRASNQRFAEEVLPRLRDEQ